MHLFKSHSPGSSQTTMNISEQFVEFVWVIYQRPFFVLFIHIMYVCVHKYSVFKYYIHNLYLTVILRGRAGYELIYITNEAVGRVGHYQLISGKFSKNNCVLVNFQAILLISSGETSSNRDIFFTDDAGKKFFRPPKFQHKKFAIRFSLFGQT